MLSCPYKYEECLLTLFSIMKKVIASFTVVVYLAFACGVMVNYHFCMDRYSSFQLYQPGSDWCSTCGMHAKKGCCHNEVKILKLQNNYQNTTASFSLQKFQPVVITPSPCLAIDLVTGENLPGKTDHSPPLITQQDTYLQNCVFRI